MPDSIVFTFELDPDEIREAINRAHRLNAAYKGGTDTFEAELGQVIAELLAGVATAADMASALYHTLYATAHVMGAMGVALEQRGLGPTDLAYLYDAVLDRTNPNLRALDDHPG